MAYCVDIIKLKKIMIECRLDKIVSLSKASGIDRNTLGLVLSGSLRPSSRVMDALVKTLEISATDAGSIFFANDLRNG